MKFSIGQPMRRHEDLRLITGRGRYTDDVILPRMAHAFVLRSPVAHAHIKRSTPGMRRAAAASMRDSVAGPVEMPSLVIGKTSYGSELVGGNRASERTASWSRGSVCRDSGTDQARIY
jgi:hypothetical protein